MAGKKEKRMRKVVIVEISMLTIVVCFSLARTEQAVPNLCWSEGDWHFELHVLT